MAYAPGGVKGPKKKKKKNCQDAGVYRCFIAYNTGTDDNPNPGQANYLQNLTVTVPPGNITISHSPAYDTYIVNQPVEFLCNGMIGSYEPGSKETWQWTWEYFDNDYQTWQQYNSENGIRKETPISVPGTCSYRQTYYLTLALSEKDSERQYRCKVVRSSNTAVSETITLGAVHPEGWAPTPSPTQTNNTCRCTCSCSSTCSPP
ncbi:uncharacterized protein LOC112567964 [Pomacea canaliculata]|uniref:uncharacterized protein LOC112567964 n=1 Tax=Pomacea canaliculata TaxID=400727 RepID=UPI000D73216D|nr:uncharacterized protein LOC112567964 [Pomacea canaliculata]